MNRACYELDLQTAHSSGRHTAEEMVERAERLGFAGIAVADYVADVDDVHAVKNTVDTLDTGIDVRVGAKLRPEDPGDLKDMLREVRDHVDVVVVHGGDVPINKTACGDTRVDILAHPELKRKDSGLDHVAVKQASKNRVAIELNIRQLLETRGKVRAHILSHMRRNVRLAQKFDAPMITSSGANTVHYMRAPRELVSFPRILGMSLEDGFKTVTETPQKILARADSVHDDQTVQPGVRKIEDDADE